MESEPLDSILDEVTELLKVVDENKQQEIKGKISKDLMDELALLEIKVQFFKNVADQALKMSGVSGADLEKNIQGSSETPNSKSKKMVARAGQLKDRLQALEKQYDARARAAGKLKKQTSATGKKRKKKFKRLGGQGWLPL